MYQKYEVRTYVSYRFFLFEDVYFQCDVDMNGDEERVYAEFWVGKSTKENRYNVLEVPYLRIHMETEAEPTLLGGIDLLLTEEYVWECIEGLFDNKKEYQAFAKKYQPELTNELS